MLKYLIFTLCLIFIIVQSQNSSSEFENCTVYIAADGLNTEGCGSQASPCANLTYALEYCHSLGTVNVYNINFMAGEFNLTYGFDTFNKNITINGVGSGTTLNFLASDAIIYVNETEESKPTDFSLVSFNDLSIISAPQDSGFVWVEIYNSTARIELNQVNFTNFQLTKNNFISLVATKPNSISFETNNVIFSGITTTAGHIITSTNSQLNLYDSTFENLILVNGFSILNSNQDSVALNTVTVIGNVVQNSTIGLFQIYKSSSLSLDGASEFSSNSYTGVSTWPCSVLYIDTASETNVQTTLFTKNSNLFQLFVNNTVNPTSFQNNAFTKNIASPSTIYVINSNNINFTSTQLVANSVVPGRTNLVINFSKNITISNTIFNNNGDRFGNFDESLITFDDISASNNVQFILYYCMQSNVTFTGTYQLNNNTISKSGLVDCGTAKSCNIHSNQKSFYCSPEDASADNDSKSKNDSDDKKNKDLTPKDLGIIIAIIVIVLVVLILVIAYFVRRHHHKHHHYHAIH